MARFKTFLITLILLVLPSVTVAQYCRQEWKETKEWIEYHGLGITFYEHGILVTRDENWEKLWAIKHNRQLVVILLGRMHYCSSMRIRSPLDWREMWDDEEGWSIELRDGKTGEVFLTYHSHPIE